MEIFRDSLVSDREGRELIQSLDNTFADFREKLDIKLTNIWNLNQIQSVYIDHLVMQFNSLETIFSNTLDLVLAQESDSLSGSPNAGFQSFSDLRILVEGMDNMKRLITQIQRLNIWESTKVDKIKKVSTALYGSHEQMVSIYDELPMAPVNIIRMISNQLSLGISQSKSGSAMVLKDNNAEYENGGKIINHIDPHLVTKFSAFLGSKLEQHISSTSKIGAPSWTKDGTLCVVCQEEFGQEGAFVLGTCGHVYHNPCLAKFSQGTKNCHCGVPIPLEYIFSIGELDMATLLEDTCEKP